MVILGRHGEDALWQQSSWPARTGTPRFSSRLPSSEREHPHPGQPLWPDARLCRKLAQRTTKPTGDGANSRRSRCYQDREAIVVESGGRTLLPLDDVLRLPARTIPSCSSPLSTVALLGMGFRNCPDSRKPLLSVDASPRQRSHFHIEVCEPALRRGQGTISSPSIASRSSPTSTAPERHRLIGASFLRGVVATFPYKLQHRADATASRLRPPLQRSCPTAQYRLHVFDRICRENGIAHKLTKPYTPVDQGQADDEPYRQEATVLASFHYETLDSLKPTSRPHHRLTTSPNTSNRYACEPRSSHLRRLDERPHTLHHHPHHLIPGSET